MLVAKKESMNRGAGAGETADTCDHGLSGSSLGLDKKPLNDLSWRAKVTSKIREEKKRDYTVPLMLRWSYQCRAAPPTEAVPANSCGQR